MHHLSTVGVSQGSEIKPYGRIGEGSVALLRHPSSCYVLLACLLALHIALQGHALVGICGIAEGPRRELGHSTDMARLDRALKLRGSNRCDYTPLNPRLALPRQRGRTHRLQYSDLAEIDPGRHCDTLS